MTPLVSVVIPARNEEQDIESCLRSILAQDYPAGSIEVILVDGESSDRTTELARLALEGKGLAGVDIISNPVATTPTNLNLGMHAAKGVYLCRVDSRSRIPSDYIRRCVALLEQRPELAVVGGAQISQPIDANPSSVGIARALNNRWSMGGSRYRRQSESGVCDTVYLGFFRTDQVVAAGGWDETLPTNQDFDLNRRMSQYGEIWFEAEMPVGYVPRPSLRRLWKQYVRFGRWKVRYWRRGDDRPQPRQLLAVATAPVGIAGTVALAMALPGARRFLPLAGLGALAAVEYAGSDSPKAGVIEHAAGAVAMVVVAGGWSYGVWKELLFGGAELSGHDSK